MIYTKNMISFQKIVNSSFNFFSRIWFDRENCLFVCTLTYRGFVEHSWSLNIVWLLYELLTSVKKKQKQQDESFLGLEIQKSGEKRSQFGRDICFRRWKQKKTFNLKDKSTKFSSCLHEENKRRGVTIKSISLRTVG